MYENYLIYGRILGTGVYSSLTKELVSEIVGMTNTEGETIL